MSNKNYSREDVARIFIEAYTDTRAGDPHGTRSDVASSTLHYLIGYFGITEQFGANVPGFEHWAASTVDEDAPAPGFIAARAQRTAGINR